jgi:carboxypeptidase C (cathepsin A)
MRGISTEILMLAPVALVWLAGTSQSARAQGRSGQAQTETQPRPPATTPPGRGGSAQGLAIGGEIDESSAVTHHRLQVEGQAIQYTATAAQMPLKTVAGETEAHMFYVAYTQDGADPAKRPLTFCFNGGPGSASLWVHMGGMGPRSPRLMPDGNMAPPPYQIRDNPNTWLDRTDLVFVDAPGTGYSRPKTEEVAHRMEGVQGDLKAFGDFVSLYLQRNSRELSPLFIAGESYGTFRAAGLAGTLIDRGIAFNGIVLIGTTLNLETIWSRADDLVYELEMPTYAADAWYHKKTAPDLQRKDLQSFLKEAEAFALGEYSLALNKGDELPAAERKAVVEKLARFTGLEPRYIDRSNLRFDVAHFTRELLREENLTIGRYDGRLTAPASLNTGETSEFDPSSTAVTPPFVSVFTNYVRSELGYKTDMNYYVSGGILPWDYGVQNGFGDTAGMLRNAFARNPYMKVMVAASYYDLATPYFAAEHTFNHMGLNPEMHQRVSWKFYQSGHMLYIDSDSRAKLKHDVAEFMTGAMAKTE